MWFEESHERLGTCITSSAIAISFAFAVCRSSLMHVHQLLAVQLAIAKQHQHICTAAAYGHKASARTWIPGGQLS
jgi:hypothetical protein